jgi:RNA polymerase sigma-70 factor (ECF subfamily)
MTAAGNDGNGAAGAGYAPADARTALTDAQLIALAREAHHDAFDLLYQAYKGRIYTFLLRFLQDPDAADDVTQETFTKAYRALETFQADHKLLPWLYRVASNAAIDQTRRGKRFRWLSMGKVEGTSDEPALESGDREVSEREHVQATLGKLPPENAIALLLHAVEGYSYIEIAEIQGVTMTAVRSRIARARASFRKEYATK